MKLVLLLACFPLATPTIAGERDGLALWGEGARAQAISVWQADAARGDSGAALYLATIYRYGLGVAADDAQAARWYRQAAEAGDPEAQYALALMYELGLGVAQDSDEAATWYALSSAQVCPGELRAGDLLGR